MQFIAFLTISFYYPAPDRRTGYCNQAIFFVSLSARLRENGWTDLHEIFREGVEWPWDDLIKFWVNSEKPRDARERGLLCRAPQLVFILCPFYYILRIVVSVTFVALQILLTCSVRVMLCVFEQMKIEIVLINFLHGVPLERCHSGGAGRVVLVTYTVRRLTLCYVDAIPQRRNEETVSFDSGRRSSWRHRHR